MSRSVGVSCAQERLWFLDRLEPGNPAYHTSAAYRLAGRLDAPALERSLAAIVRRHETMRATFAVLDGRPVQVVAPALSLSLPVTDLSALSEAEREVEAQRLMAGAARRPFDLGRGPLWRVILLRLSATEHVLLLVMRHIVSDDWSIGVLNRELAALYEAFAAGRPSPLAELPIQYADWAHRQRQWLRGEEQAAQLAYWRQKLAGSRSVLELPTDRSRPAVQTFHGARHTFMLPRDLSQALEAQSRRRGVTLFLTLLAAFEALLYRYTGQDDILIGVPIANRNRAETEGLIGPLANTLVLRSDLSGDPTFEELLDRLRETTAEAYAHQDLPFEKLVEELRPERDLSRNPFFQVSFALQRAPAEAPSLPGLSVSLLALDSGATQLDLTWSMTETEQGLKGDLAYNTDLFDAATIRRLAACFQTLLTGVVANPGLRLSALPFSTAAERRQLLAEWNDTDADYPRDECLQQLFEAQVRRTPEAIAVVFGEEQLSYAALNRRANQLARRLQGLGVGPEVLVGVCLERSLAMVVGLLGILKAGGAYAPLDPTYPQERLAFTLQDTQAPVLLTQQKLNKSLPGHDASVVYLDADWAAIAGKSAANPASAVTADNLAYVIYTSGSTGRPKGVAIAHRSAATLLRWAAKVFDAEALAGVLASTSICFDLSVFELFAPLSWGGKVILAGNALHLPGLSAAQDVTLVNTVPSAIVELLRMDGGLPDSVRAVNLAGEPLRTPLVKQIYQRDHVRQVADLYGPSEDTTYSTFALRNASGPDTIGRPIANTQVYLLDAGWQPAPIGAPGELYVGGAGLARGYLNRPQMTADRFVPHPFSNEAGARLYQTGDLARYLPDGSIEFLGRLDHQVKVRGYRIELGEIEAVLEQHPGVRQAVVLAQEDEPGSKQLAAYVVARGERELTAVELRRFLKDRLPEYMLPSAWVMLAALPLTPSGKIDRRALLSPRAARPELEAGYTAPRTPVQEVLAGIWAEVLKLERVGICDDFFELGGHSLLATQVISRLRQAFQVELPLHSMFESPTLVDSAAAIEAIRRAAPQLRLPSISPAPRDRDLPLSFAQQRLWFLDQLKPGSPAYNIPLAYRLAGSLDVAALAQSLDEIVRRHEALRTTFATAAGRPAQVIASALSLSLLVTDLSALSEAEREVEAQRLMADAARRPFDLGRGPLWRVILLRLGATGHVLLLVMHHIVSDDWSIGVLNRELAALYEAFAAGRPSPLAALPVQYADWAHWQQQWLQGEVLETQLSYWQQQLSGSLPVLELPTDRPRPAVQSFEGDWQSFLLTDDLSQALKAQSRQGSVTLFITLLAAFEVLLYRYTGQADIVVGAPIANRNRAETEDLIGFFVNTLALRTDLSGDPTFEELLGRVREAALAAYAHQDLPFEKLVEELQPERDLSHNPLFQVMLVLQNVEAGALSLPGLALSALDVESRTAKFDLTLSLMETERGLKGRFEYATDLFDAATIARLAAHFQTLLTGVVADPGRRLSALPLLTAAEQQQLLVEWNDTQAHYAQDVCIHHLFEAQVERVPDVVAVVLDEQHLTYEGLNRRANQLAHYLQKLGVGPETVVGICVVRSLEMIVGLLGILKAGGAYLPLDPVYPKERLSFQLDDTQIPVLLAQQSLVEGLVERKMRVVCLDTDWGDLADESRENLTDRVRPENLVYVIYTSGSTGRPKGVLVTHQNLVQSTMARLAYYYQPEITFLLLSSFAFDSSVAGLFDTLCRGSKLVLPPESLQQDLRRLVALIAQHRISHLLSIPSLYALILAQAEPQQLDGLCTAIVAGEPCLRELVGRHVELLPHALLFNEYGPTEGTVWSNVYCCQFLGAGQHVPIGRSIANTQVYLSDSHLQPTPIGVPGELLIGGSGLARGYLNRPGLTAERFVPHPFSEEPGARLYRAGDLVRCLSDGNIEFLGRADHQVKVRGFRIELSEIEAVLSQHSDVQETIVLAREDRPGDKRLVAYVVPRNKQALTVGELRGFLEEKLPDYMLPSVFMLLDALPLTPNGKVDRRVLPTPDETHLGLDRPFIAPRTPVEERLAEIWGSLLGLERVSVHDNFFELGGHSLLASQLLSRVCQAFQVELSLRRLFETPTIAGLAVVVAQSRAEQEDGDEIARILAELESLSEEEARLMLGAERQ